MRNKEDACESRSDEQEARREGDSAHRTMARGQGFEPRLTAPEAVVLPLDDPRIKVTPEQYMGFLEFHKAAFLPFAKIYSLQLKT